MKINMKNTSFSELEKVIGEKVNIVLDVQTEAGECRGEYKIMRTSAIGIVLAEVREKLKGENGRTRVTVLDGDITTVEYLTYKQMDDNSVPHTVQVGRAEDWIEA